LKGYVQMAKATAGSGCQGMVVVALLLAQWMAVCVVPGAGASNASEQFKRTLRLVGKGGWCRGVPIAVEW
jgi:hypothetical protein